MKNVTSREDARYTEGSSSPQLNDGAPPLHRMAMSEMTTYRWTFPEDVTAYREAGVDAIGIWRNLEHDLPIDAWRDAWNNSRAFW